MNENRDTIFFDTCAVVPLLKDDENLTSLEIKHAFLLNNFISEFVRNPNKKKKQYNVACSALTKAELHLKYYNIEEKWNIVTLLFISCKFDDLCAEKFYQIDKLNDGLNAYNKKIGKCKRNIKTDWEIISTACRYKAAMFVTEDREILSLKFPDRIKPIDFQGFADNFNLKTLFT